MGHGSVWELGPAAEKIARKCLRILDAKVLTLGGHLFLLFLFFPVLLNLVVVLYMVGLVVGSLFSRG